LAFLPDVADEPASDDPEVTIGKTGVSYRPVVLADAGGDVPIQLVANSDTEVPNPGAYAPGTTFGSNSPPSAAGDHMVFVGFDNACRALQFPGRCLAAGTPVALYH
jgi:hypothetical protein